MIPRQVVVEHWEHCSVAAKKHLQLAYDAFHQQDYETARLQFHIVLKKRGKLEEALIGLAITYFHLGDYENAFLYMWKNGELKDHESGIVNLFKDTCIEAMAALTANKPHIKPDELVFAENKMEDEEPVSAC